MFVLKKTHMV